MFDPITIREMVFKNRIWLAPMCQYSVPIGDGVPTDWHLMHLGARAAGGFGLVMAEATAVTPEGRITPQDTGLWADHQIEAWQRIVEFCHNQSALVGIQLAHAGRKASTYRGFPGEPTGGLGLTAGGWVPVGPTTTAHSGLERPVALTPEQMEHHVQLFAQAARRAHSAGFDVVEVHAAHGYLLHQFLSPIANTRTDEFGGSLENRCRFPLAVLDAVRKNWPSNKPLFLRISATDWLPDGLTVEESSQFCQWATQHGVDLIDVSSGGIAPATIDVHPGYQVPLAAHIKSATGTATAAVGLLTEPEQAQDVLVNGAADAVFVGRAALREPNWPQRAASQLGVRQELASYPDQYLRGAWPHPHHSN